MTQPGHEGDPPLEMEITSFDLAPALAEGYAPLVINTSRGGVEGRYYGAPKARHGVIWVGGVGGGWDTPAQGLYPRLCRELVDEAIASLRVRYRNPVDLEEATLDVLAGLYFLEQQGVESAALVGWSFGGAVVAQAAADSERVRTVVTLATQSYGADAVIRFAPDTSILLLHGSADGTLSPACSQHIAALAREPKRLVVFEGAQHGLDEVVDEVHSLIYNWIVEQLKGPKPDA